VRAVILESHHAGKARRRETPKNLQADGKLPNTTRLRSDMEGWVRILSANLPTHHLPFTGPRNTFPR